MSSSGRWPARPHVLYVTPIFGYPALGGPRLRTYNTVRALARLADVTLYVTQQPDTADREAARAHLLTFCRDVIFPPPPSAPSGLGARLRRLARRAVPRSLREPLRQALSAVAVSARAGSKQRVELVDFESTDKDSVARPEAETAALRAAVAAIRPDVLWLGFGGISYDLVPLKHAADAPVVLETECVWSRFVLREAPFELDPMRRERILAEGRAKEAEERQGATEVDLTTAVSHVDAEYFRTLSASDDRVMLLSNVIDVQAYVAGAVPHVSIQQPAVVFAGTLSRGTANVDATLWLIDDVMTTVWQHRPDVHLYIVGRNPAAAIVARRGPRVHVTGEVPSIVPYMTAARAAVVPLRWESGTRFKILEAFACRAPVVSTTLGAEGLAVEHGRHLLLADDPAAFADAILSLIEDRTLRARLVAPAYELVRSDYDLSSAERQIAAILERLGQTRADGWADLPSSSAATTGSQSES